MGSRLVILRGNSGSGKTTTAKLLQKELGYGTMLVSQDAIRREILRVRDEEGNPAIQLIYDLCMYGSHIGYTVILEGILSNDKYGSMVRTLIRDFDGDVSVYYFDISFEETVRRHAEKPNSHEFGKKEMAQWWKDKDYLGVEGEYVINESITKDQIVSLVKVINLGTTADNKNIFLNYDNTNVEYHLLETPNLVELVKEAVPHLVLGDSDQVVLERDMGRIIGTTNLVKTDDGDDIVYAKRISRDKYSRFAKNREPKSCRSIVIVFRKRGGEYYLWAAMCGELLPPEAYDEDSEFNATHAMVYDEKLIQLSTLTKSKPVATVQKHVR